MSTINYDDRFQSLGLDRSELRRPHADLITCYKIINNTSNGKYHMAYLFVPFLVILDDLESHSPNAGLMKCNSTNICATLARF